jgi:hypothetical protein
VNPTLPDNNPADNQQIIDQIDDFIKGLDTPPGTTVATSVVTRTAGEVKEEPKIEAPKTDAEMKEFVLKHSANLVENSVKSILELQKLTVATGDPEMMSGLASLIAASSNAIETVNKIQLQSQKIEAAKEIKKIELEGKKEIQRLKNDGYASLPAGQTNILVATREEIIAQLTGKAKVAHISDPNTIEVVTLSSAP